MLARTKAEIRARLQLVCAHMSEAMFEELVEKIALNERRSIQRGGAKWNVISNRSTS